MCLTTTSNTLKSLSNLSPASHIKQPVWRSIFIYSASDMKYKRTLWEYYKFLTLNLTTTAGLGLTLTSNIFQKQGCILPSTLDDSLRLRAVLLVQFVDNAFYACLPLLTSAVKEHKDFIKYSQSTTNKTQLFTI